MAEFSYITQNRGQGLLTLTRIIIEASVAFFITAALIDYGYELTRLGNFMARLQIVPAALIMSLSILIFWLAVTLIFGRIYCSTMCPLGALIDLFSRTRGRNRQYHYSKPREWLRTLSLGLFLILLVSRIVPRAWIEPYGYYAEIVTHVFSPRLSLACLIAVVAVVPVALTAWRRGRWICNNICPVGTALGVVAQKSAMHIDIDTDRCIQCRKCEHACKSECIDLQSHVIDMSRCVVCFDCLPVCPNEAISYTAGRHTLSIPMMQKLNTSTTSLCNNTSTFSPTSSATEQSKQIAPEPEQ